MVFKIRAHDTSARNTHLESRSRCRSLPSLEPLGVHGPEVTQANSNRRLTSPVISVTCAPIRSMLNCGRVRICKGKLCNHYSSNSPDLKAQQVIRFFLSKGCRHVRNNVGHVGDRVCVTNKHLSPLRPADLVSYVGGVFQFMVEIKPRGSQLELIDFASNPT